nr:hypothetical protein [Tanacetum cinerariifolium]
TFKIVLMMKRIQEAVMSTYDLEEEYQARAYLSKSKKFFKKELSPTKDFKAKYNKVKAKLALLSLSASTSKASTIKNKGLIAEAYEWDEEEVSLDDNEMVEVKGLIALAEDNVTVSKKRVLGVDQLTKDLSSSGQKDLVFVKSLADDTKVSIPGVKRPWLSKAKGFILPNHDTGRILPAESQRNTTDPSVGVTNSLASDYDSADESSVCSTPLPPLKKLDGAEPTSEPKTIKSNLRTPFIRQRVLVHDVTVMVIPKIQDVTWVASLFFWQWQPSSLAVGTSSASGNSIPGSGNTLCILLPTILP